MHQDGVFHLKEHEYHQLKTMYVVPSRESITKWPTARETDVHLTLL